MPLSYVVTCRSVSHLILSLLSSCHFSIFGRNLGTVGAVALDRNGNVAYATSTGGIVNKMVGRVGDTPCIGGLRWWPLPLSIHCHPPGFGEDWEREMGEALVLPLPPTNPQGPLLSSLSFRICRFPPRGLCTQTLSPGLAQINKKLRISVGNY